MDTGKEKRRRWGKTENSLLCQACMLNVATVAAASPYFLWNVDVVEPCSEEPTGNIGRMLHAEFEKLSAQKTVQM